MYSVLKSYGLNGLNGFAVAVEADVSGGLPAFSLVGLPDSAVRESGDRVRSAVKNLGYKWPDRHITVNGTIAPLIELGAGFDMDLTARENIYLNGTVLGYTPKYIDSKFDDIVEFSELQDFLDVPLKNYSSGMVARLAFAVATMTKPDILIADEILSVGDFLFQEKCEKRMAELLSGGTTVILVSHSIDQIERMCNKVAWLDHGHLRRLGPTKEITAEYRRFEKKDAMPAKVTEE